MLLTYTGLSEPAWLCMKEPHLVCIVCMQIRIHMSSKTTMA